MNKVKGIFATVFTVVAITSFSFAVGCADDGLDPLEVDKTPSGSTGLSFEYMTDAEIPVDAFSGLTQGEVNEGKVTFVFTSPEYKEKGKTVQDVYHSEFPGIYCDVVGEWKVTYVMGKEYDTKTFNVVDTIAPTFDIASSAYDIWFDAEFDAEGNMIDQGSYYELPMIFPDDLSEFDYDTYEMKLTLDTNPDSEEDEIIDVEIEGEEGYYAPAAGKMTYTIAIADIHGNRSEYTTFWNVKDPKWVDENLAEGYLADYDEEGYINTALSGEMSSYWSKSELYEEYFTKEEFKEATGVDATSGVLKVSAVPTDSYAVGAFKFRLQKTLTQEEIGNKYLVVKFYTPNNVETVRFGAQTWQSMGNPPRKSNGTPIEACDSQPVTVTKGDWSFAIISAADLKYGYFDIGDTEIKEFHIAFGERTVSVQDDLIELYIDSVALADKLPEIKGYSLKDKVLSWEEVTGATSYEVIEDGVKCEVDTNAYTVTNPDGVITVRAISNEARYISADYATTFINMNNFGEDDLALFDSDSYESTVTMSARAERKAKTLEVDRLESYEGEKNVLKVVTTTKSNGIGDFRIKLPKECTDGITLKFMIKQTGANFFYWSNPSLGDTVSISNSANILANQELGDMAGKWQVVYIPYASSETVKDVIEVVVSFVAGENVNKEDIVTEVYFAQVLNGDCRGNFEIEKLQSTLSSLENKLADSYLADFTSAEYEKLAVSDTWYGHHVAESVTAEYVASFKGYTDLLKVRTLNNDKGFGNFTLFLPKEMGESGYTVRFYLETTSTAALRIIKPRTEGADFSANGGVNGILKEFTLATVNGLWTEVFVPYTDKYKQEITFQIWGNEDGVNVFYIDYVATGDVVDEMIAARRQEMVDNLPAGYLAAFSSKAYEECISADTWGGHHVAESITAEYVDSFKGYTDLLKVTTLNNASGFGNFTLHLPKAMGNSGYTVRFYLETTSTAALRVIKPHTEGANYSANGGVNGILQEYSIAQVNGLWTEVFIPYTEEFKQEMTFQIWGNADGVNVFYIDYVADGDVVNQMKTIRKNAMSEALEAGYLADFSSQAYEECITVAKASSTYTAASLTVEYVAENAQLDATNLVKITTVNNGNGSCFGGFAIDLPKAIPTDSGFTVRFYIESTESIALRIINPTTGATRVSTSHEWSSETLTAIVGMWMEVYVPYSEAYAYPEIVEFCFFMGNGAKNVIYIDSIVAGDQTQA